MNGTQNTGWMTEKYRGRLLLKSITGLIGGIGFLAMGAPQLRAQCQQPPASIVNLTHPDAGTMFQINDYFQVTVCGAASSTVTQIQSKNGGNFGTMTTVGSTGSNGIFQASSYFSNSNVGNWKNIYFVGGVQVDATVTFSVSSVAPTAPALTTTEFVYLGDRAVSEIHTAPLAFSDVSNTASYANDVDVLYADGILSASGNPNACAAGQFCPTANLTRDYLAVLIVRSIFVALNGAGNEDNFTYTTTPYFTDVPSSYWAFKWIQKLRDMSLTSGCTNSTTYCPTTQAENYDTLIFSTRGRLCVASGAANGCGQPSTSSPCGSSYPASAFSYLCAPAYFNDVTYNGSNSTEYPYVQLAASQAIISTTIPGCTAGNFCVTNAMTNSLCAMWLVRGILGESSY